ncbi:histidine phosphatase family protein [Pleionea mediterranea]|jgi:alpha-ribazole phosphatase|uniref:Alpha-ribazole phosphatase n=1 Tax=Pleionea mediterranea TaxID=523701 RepID=A0A316FD60_9GAMM|nr:histidine phosphatase family protein [Pleionea mediterranea]PWK46363.1 alpha-ribazole phosphatase [Pleionea mediterranea]
MVTDLYLIRHGEPVLTGALLGATDSPLSDTGWQQLTEAFNRLPKFDHLIASSLSRCAAFAQEFSQQQLSQQQSIPLTIDPQWRECHFGQWDGIAYQTLHRESPQAVERFFQDPYRHTPPDGESLQDFHQRILTALFHLLDQHSEKRVVVLCHAGVIRTLVAWCLNMDYQQGDQFKRFSIDYGSMTHLRLFKNESPTHNQPQYFAQLQLLNDTGHSLNSNGATDE